MPEEQKKNVPVEPATPPPHHASPVGHWIAHVVAVFAVVILAIMLVLQGEYDQLEDRREEARQEQIAERLQDVREDVQDRLEEDEGLTTDDPTDDLLDLEEDGYREYVVQTDSPYGFQGVSELVGYYTVVERLEDLNDESTVQCAAFVVTDGSAQGLEYLESVYDYSTADFDEPVVILGDIDSFEEKYAYRWDGSPDVTESTPDDPVTALFRVGSSFEGEVVGCFYPYADLIGTVS